MEKCRANIIGCILILFIFPYVSSLKEEELLQRYLHRCPDSISHKPEPGIEEQLRGQVQELKIKSIY
jgi:hypothetical protein